MPKDVQGVGVGYSGARSIEPTFRPHDLVRVDLSALPIDTPAWAHAVLASGQPAVVRRAERANSWVPIGIRGDCRNQRSGLWVGSNALSSIKAPETLIDASPDRRRADAIAALGALVPLRAMMMGWAWGLTGAVGYELATGVGVAHRDSDIDLLIRLPKRPPSRDLIQLAARLDSLPVRCDVQLETPAGGVALADWLSSAPEVLIKSDRGPFLASDPWAKIESIRIDDDRAPRVLCIA